VDAVRSLLDGHVVLSRALAAEGCIHPIQILDSSAVSARGRRRRASRTGRAYPQAPAVYARSEDLVRIGAYKPGADPDLDRALKAAECAARLYDAGRARGCSFWPTPLPAWPPWQGV